MTMFSRTAYMLGKFARFMTTSLSFRAAHLAFIAAIELRALPSVIALPILAKAHRASRLSLGGGHCLCLRSGAPTHPWLNRSRHVGNLDLGDEHPQTVPTEIRVTSEGRDHPNAQRTQESFEPDQHCQQRLMSVGVKVY